MQCINDINTGQLRHLLITCYQMTTQLSTHQPTKCTCENPCIYVTLTVSLRSIN
jgi:hypothetical protein